MKFFLFCLPVLLISYLGPLPAAATEATIPSREKVEQHKEQVRSPEQERKSPAKKKHPAATTFTPSEKIDADTVIAFPVDI